MNLKQNKGVIMIFKLKIDLGDYGYSTFATRNYKLEIVKETPKFFIISLSFYNSTKDGNDSGTSGIIVQNLKVNPINDNINRTIARLAIKFDTYLDKEQASKTANLALDNIKKQLQEISETTDEEILKI